MGLEMADAACFVSLRAHRYNACSLHRVMLCLGKHHFGGAVLCEVVAWAIAVDWKGEGIGKQQGDSPAPPRALLGFVSALCQLLEFAIRAGSGELWCWTVLHVARPCWLQPWHPPGESCLLCLAGEAASSA